MTDHTIRTTSNAMGTIAAPETPGTTALARGKVTAGRDGLVVFAPHGTNYELDLAAPGYPVTVWSQTQAVIRVPARKVCPVPSGGTFISPLFGPPRIVQGRVKALHQRTLVVQARTPVVVDLPEDLAVIELAHGTISVGALV